MGTVQSPGAISALPPSLAFVIAGLWEWAHRLVHEPVTVQAIRPLLTLSMGS